MLHGGGLEKAIPARTIETHSPPGIEKTLNNMLREKLIWVVFQGACDGNAKISRNIAQKLKNTEKLNFLKNQFF